MSATLQPGPVSRPSATPHRRRGGFFTHHGLWAPGVRLFRQLDFTAKALIISLTFFVPMLALLGWQLHEQSAATMQQRLDATRQHVEVVHGVIGWAHRQETEAGLSREQAQALARRVVSGLRYDRSEYFWINDMQHRMVMHPTQPALDGQQLGDRKDPNGVPLFQAFVSTVRDHGQGFVHYQWPKPGLDRPVDKVSYVKGFEPWGWVVGSGVYVDDVQAAVQRQLTRSGVILLLSVLVSVYFFLSFYRVMNGGLKETRRHLMAMTAGDLTTSPAPWGRDEPAQLMHDLCRMQEALRQMVARMRLSSDAIMRSSGSIATGMGDLSARSEQAAANLEQSATSMEQMSATLRSSSAHTQEAAEVARDNARIATQGGQVMGEVVATMEAIQASSTRIGEIIGSIDGIAFQTNILALNAAVEAARAGEQGRGFAVVASEVRTLAQRSAQAAREIKTLIGSSVDQVEAGTAVVRRAGATIDDIVTASQRVHGLLDTIATGSREQSAGIGQIGQAVQELDRATQQNAALVQQTATESASMNDQARHLADEVARFRLPQPAPRTVG
ncbi:methyl-accepting chemotaxis sensory transducer with Cache sensor [Sphaerotilus hippei]|uniref:Methyl-accepting chemotaxis sensory transducer with Cache sensor n=1 Tax=Sphaerotilus hippei TaxID=744406 RepID=A0A318H2F9_9BURK|nr:methyl-accepting chemotaxis protein [Sphaerotilus hippei]PXW97423.1 methyl-accepting chemotaxis sensory transducer with Cache sensor [Sphaerotilus hippei]